MADPITIVGLVSSIITFIEFGAKVIKRVDELQSRNDDIPAVFRDIKVQLSLLLADLQQTQRRIETEKVDLYTKSAVKAVCRKLPISRQCKLIGDSP